MVVDIDITVPIIYVRILYIDYGIILCFNIILLYNAVIDVSTSM